MKISHEWLLDHIALDLSPAQVGERLTAAGHAVDGMETIEGDTVYDLDIVTNRPDCMSARGLARDLAAALDLPLLDPAGTPAVEEHGDPAEERIRITVEEPTLCRRFMVRVVRGVRVGPSPEWLASRLRRIGLRPVSNLVDITNYVMFDLGHPMHAFDLGTLHGAELHIRRAAAGERLVTLDGVERKLEDWMLLIADADRPVSLAGVMGGAETEISDRTTDVLLEAAWWDPVTIYRTGRALGLSSDASYRFERGSDIQAPRATLDRAARLCAELAGGSVAPGVVDVYPTPWKPRRVPLRRARAAALLGVEVDAPEAEAILGRLGFGVESGEADGPTWQVEAPSYRLDVSREEDLIEEIGRIMGYDRIPETLPRFESAEHGRLPGSATRRTIERLLEASGFFQAINFSFVSREEDARFSPEPDRVVPLANPMSASGDVLRSSLLPHLVRNVQHNVHFGTRRVQLYELGRVFEDRPGAELPVERLHLGLATAGTLRPPHWSDGGPPEADVFDLTGAVEQVLAHLRVPAPEARPAAAAFLAPGSGIEWRDGGRRVAWFGRLHGPAADALDLDCPVHVAEVVLDPLLEEDREPLRIRPLPRFPSVVRDLSLVLPVERGYAEVAAAIRSAGGETVTEVTPFDRYTGKGLPDGTVGLSVSICFQHPERTLVSEEVDALQQRIVAALERDLGARLRK